MSHETMASILGYGMVLLFSVSRLGESILTIATLTIGAVTSFLAVLLIKTWIRKRFPETLDKNKKYFDK